MAKEPKKLIANNKKVYHDYFLDEKYEAGISLAGTEVKSLRMGKGSIKEAFIRIENGEVYLVKQFRYPFQEVLTEVPAGKLEFGENHRDAGLRELKEETGAECENFEYLGVMYPSVAYLTEKIHMYLATGLKFDKQSLDEDEFLDVIKVKLSDAVDMVLNGEIKDGKTQTALLLAARKLGI